MRLPGILGEVAIPPQAVLPLSDWLHVGGIDARCVPARVVDYEPRRDRAYEVFVGQAVSLFIRTVFTADPQDSVTPLVTLSNPGPTAIA